MTKVWDPFWISILQTEFVPQLNAIVNVLEKRLLPNLEKEKIEEEADRITNEDWERFMSMPATGNEDPSYFADRAENAGIAHYTLMYGIRQGMLNWFVTALYHAFDQQVMFFHRKNVLHLCEENDPNKFRLAVFERRLTSACRRHPGTDVQYLWEIKGRERYIFFGQGCERVCGIGFGWVAWTGIL